MRRTELDTVLEAGFSGQLLDGQAILLDFKGVGNADADTTAKRVHCRILHESLMANMEGGVVVTS